MVVRLLAECHAVGPGAVEVGAGVECPPAEGAFAEASGLGDGLDRDTDEHVADRDAMGGIARPADQEGIAPVCRREVVDFGVAHGRSSLERIGTVERCAGVSEASPRRPDVAWKRLAM